MSFYNIKRLCPHHCPYDFSAAVKYQSQPSIRQMLGVSESQKVFLGLLLLCFHLSIVEERRRFLQCNFGFEWYGVRFLSCLTCTTGFEETTFDAIFGVMLAEGKKVLSYNGDLDFAANHIGGEQARKIFCFALLTRFSGLLLFSGADKILSIRSP